MEKFHLAHTSCKKVLLHRVRLSFFFANTDENYVRCVKHKRSVTALVFGVLLMSVCGVSHALNQLQDTFTTIAGEKIHWIDLDDWADKR